jgi:organic radical activating enzyme
LVITGGEPLLQQSAILELISSTNFTEAKPHRLTVQIETNGDYAISEELAEKARIVCSPKAWERKNAWKSLKPDNFKYVAYFRHLISADKNNAYYKVSDVILDFCKKHEKSIYLSPITVYRNRANVKEIDKGWAGEAISEKATLKNYARCAEYAHELLKQGITARLSCQAHLFFGVE